MAPRKTHRARGHSRQRLRIIGGRWRGQRIGFRPLPGLRPTPDRVRETLFNWLQPVIEGAHCLDLFAGSGALALEAASRGAASVTLVERDPGVAGHLRDLCASFAAPRITVIETDACHFLNRRPGPYDLVFLDPPFGSGLVERCLPLVTSGGVLNGRAMVYLEYPARGGPPGLPPTWVWFRHRQAGEVGYGLAHAGPGEAGA